MSQRRVRSNGQSARTAVQQGMSTTKTKGGEQVKRLVILVVAIVTLCVLSMTSIMASPDGQKTKAEQYQEAYPEWSNDIKGKAPEGYKTRAEQYQEAHPDWQPMKR